MTARGLKSGQHRLALGYIQGNKSRAVPQDVSFRSFDPGSDRRPVKNKKVGVLAMDGVMGGGSRIPQGLIPAQFPALQLYKLPHYPNTFRLECH